MRFSLQTTIRYNIAGIYYNLVSPLLNSSPPPPPARQSLVGQGLLIIDASRSHSGTPHSVGLLWTSDQSDVTSTWQHTTLTTDRHPCSSTGFEPTIPASERPKTHALERVATGIGF